MTTMVIPLRAEPAGTEEFKIALFEGEFLQASAASSSTINHTRDIPAYTARGFGSGVPIVGHVDALTTP